MWASVVWLMPPWVLCFNSFQSAAAAAGLVPRLAVPFFTAMAPIVAVMAFGTAQFYQSAGLLSMFGVIKPQTKEADQLRWFFYFMEFSVVFSVVFGTGVGGWRGKSLTHLMQLVGYAINKPMDFLGSLLNIAAQTMAAEFLIAMTFTAIILALKIIRVNGGHAIKQQGITANGAAADWGAGARNTAKAATTAPAQPKSTPPNAFKHGEQFQDTEGVWKIAINDASGKQKIKTLAAGLQIEIGGVKQECIMRDGQLLWDVVTAKQPPATPKHSPRPQRRNANLPDGYKTVAEKRQEAQQQPMEPLYQAVAYTAATQAGFTTETPGTIGADGNKQAPARPPRRVRTPR